MSGKSSQNDRCSNHNNIPFMHQCSFASIQKVFQLPSAFPAKSFGYFVTDIQKLIFIQENGSHVCIVCCSAFTFYSEKASFINDVPNFCVTYSSLIIKASINIYLGEMWHDLGMMYCVDLIQKRRKKENSSYFPT